MNPDDNVKRERRHKHSHKKKKDDDRIKRRGEKGEKGEKGEIMKCDCLKYPTEDGSYYLIVKNGIQKWENINQPRKSIKKIEEKIINDKDANIIQLYKYDKNFKITMKLKSNSSYMIKNFEVNNKCIFKFLDPKKNILQNRILNKNAIFYTNDFNMYELFFNFNQEPTTTLKIEFLSEYNNIKLDKKILFIELNECFIKNFKNQDEYYLIIINFNHKYKDFVKKLKYYTLFSNLSINKESLKTILKARFIQKQGYVYENNQINLKDSYNDIIDELIENKTHNLTTVSLATYPKRKDMILDTLNTLYKQVDVINVFFNSYDIDDVLNISKKIPNINYIIDSIGNFRAAGKFFWSNEENIHFICDDDIYYPQDYVKKGKEFLNTDEEGIFSCLGVVFPEKVIQFPKGKYRKENIRFTGECIEMMKVHLIGTGVCFFKGGEKFPPLETFLEFVTYNDDTLALIAKEENINLYTIPKKGNWLKSNEKMEIGLFEEKSYDPITKVFLEKFKQKNPWN